MKKRYFFIIFLLIIILSYITNISQIPERIILLEGEKLNFKKLYGINITTKENDVLEAWGQEKVENHKLNVTLLGNIKVKEVSVTTLPAVKVVPVGKLIGLKLYTNGVLVIGMTEIENINKQMEKPYENTGIQEGDTILEINNQEIDCIRTLQKVVNNSLGSNLEIKYAHNRRDTNIKYESHKSKSKRIQTRTMGAR
jgi:stage IV sporulation protein B